MFEHSELIMEEDEIKDWKEILEQAEDIKKSLSLESIDTALLIMIHQDVDTLRFHNSD